jgi:hypothetical protein
MIAGPHTSQNWGKKIPDGVTLETQVNLQWFSFSFFFKFHKCGDTINIDKTHCSKCCLIPAFGPVLSSVLELIVGPRPRFQILKKKCSKIRLRISILLKPKQKLDTSNFKPDTVVPGHFRHKKVLNNLFILKFKLHHVGFYFWTFWYITHLYIKF